MAVVIRGGRALPPEDGDQVPVARNYVNVEQEVLHVTVDKLRLCLTERIGQLKKSREWIAPLGIVLTLLATLVGSTFRNNILKAGQWEVVFWIAFGAGVLWLAWAGWTGCRNRVTVESIVEELKSGSGGAD